uniref:Uncharacterized protein n=1 Tax=Timema monikensis TaxID=170555 RepID=A0A7R9EHM7_9NEOP|nr:unnamed protein product [Timema monikensis]
MTKSQLSLEFDVSLTMRMTCLSLNLSLLKDSRWRLLKSAPILFLLSSPIFSLNHTSPVCSSSIPVELSNLLSQPHVSSPLLFHSCRALQSSPSTTRLQSAPLPFLLSSPIFFLSHMSPVHSSSIPVELSNLLPQPHVSTTCLQSTPLPFLSSSPIFSLNHTSPVCSSSIPVELSNLLSQPHVSSPLLFHSCRALQSSPSTTRLQSAPLPFLLSSPIFFLSHMSPVHSSSIPVDLSNLLSQPHVSNIALGEEPTMDLLTDKFKPRRLT